MTWTTGSGTAYPYLVLQPNPSGTGGSVAAPSGPQWRYGSEADLHRVLGGLGWPPVVEPTQLTGGNRRATVF